MSKISKIKVALAKLIADTFASITTDKGILVFDEDELAVDVAVFIENEDGERLAAEDGEYKLEDGRTIIVADGKVAEIREAEEAPAEADAPAEEEIAAEEEVENPTNEGEETDNEAIVKLRKEVNDLYAIVDTLVKRIEALEKEPAREPAEEEFSKTKIGDVKNNQIDNLRKLFK